VLGIVEAKLWRRWSPEQIAGWLKATFFDVAKLRVSHVGIYWTLYVQSHAA
jgi:IS30 family transposase